MNSVSDAGVVESGHLLRSQLASGDLITPFHSDDGSTVMVWAGRADAVELATWMPSFPIVPPFQQIQPNLWVLRLDLPATAMIEYRLAVRRGHEISVVLDPLNPNQTSNPFGVNSVATGPARRRPEWALHRPDSPSGSVRETRIASQAWGGRRHHHVYTPPQHASQQPHPLVVVHDGSDFLNHAALRDVLDNLINDGVIPPVVALLHEPRRRLTEYADDPRHIAHLFDEIRPRLKDRYPLDDRCVVIGSSLGAVASLSAGWRRPEQVTGMALLSGSFADQVSPDRPGEIFDPIVDLVGQVDADRRLAPVNCFVSCGRYEGLIELNRSLVPRLRSTGMQVVYEETWDGHQWASWRDQLKGALTVGLG